MVNVWKRPTNLIENGRFERLSVAQVIPTKPRQFKHALRHKADPILSMVYKRRESLT